MLDNLLMTGDLLRIASPLGGAIVPQAAIPIPLVGTSRNVRIRNRPVCIAGNELPPAVRGPLLYTTPSHTIPGTGQLQLVLPPPNRSVRTKNNAKPLLLKGRTFPVMFRVASPAQMPTAAGPVPDLVLVKIGSGQFVSGNFQVKGG